MNIGGADALEEDLDLAPDGQHPPEELSIEQRARTRGWKPLEEFNGDPAMWRSAEEFLRRGEEHAGLIRAQNRELEGKIHRLENQIAGLKKTSDEQLDALREMRVIAANNDRRGYDRAMRELKEQRAAAVEAGDRTAFDQVEEQIEALGTRPVDPPPPAPPPPAEAPPAQVDPDVTAFIEENPWYVDDQQLMRTMISHYDIVARRNPRWTVAQNLEEAKARTIAEYPERFPEMANEPPAAPRRHSSSVARPSAVPQRPPRSAAGWEQIADPEERRQAQGAFQRQQRADEELTEAEFLALYLDPHLDVLALRAKRKKA